MRPIVHGLENKYGSCIEFVYLDIDNPDTRAAQTQYKFLGQPLLVLVDENGQELWRKFGFVSEEALETELGKVVP